MGPQITIGQAIAGVIAFISAATFVFCFVTLKYYVDTDNLNSDQLADLYKNKTFPSPSQMTPAGKVRYYIAIASLLIAVAIFGFMVVAKDLSG